MTQLFAYHYFDEILFFFSKRKTIIKNYKLQKVLQNKSFSFRFQISFRKSEKTKENKLNNNKIRLSMVKKIDEFFLLLSFLSIQSFQNKKI